ncbi:PLP-dependent aminotransferase family protein [Flavobacterium sp. Fl-318]|uniref:PLP-dependent aminotransferase family protein n=1 Tax=Flavobacterium cupriresistens TaxID=2893885 RepID=A0ABU4RHB4_9FLAO|nr:MULTISPECIES: PLP-dependent aminotransferase family protein [unclassified Flavobacterium]MDX6191947.1 PLP-dependent aminotransferase family protein [Flavobacterium sp. Fl-318]UFH44586.1 PLP-dependent aminotransferase family protein [Flavobacterium sp. F-323]
MKEDFLYNRIAQNIANKIKTGVLKTGEKLPSVRILSKEHGISINTSKKVFLELESQSLIQSKPQSGYFVSPLHYLKLPLPETSKPSLVADNREPNELIDRVYSNMGNHELTLFSIGVPSGNLLPLAKLKKEIVLATRSLKDGGTEYESLLGNLKLRRMIAVRSLAWGGALKETDLITTNGCMNSIALCLMALTKPGDTIALESPCYPGILQLAVSMGLKVLEVATHPVSGIDIDAFEQLLPEINICLLVPNFNTPLGYCMSDENKKRIVTLLEKYNIPLIEDDTYGDLYFGTERPKCCKSFDTTGNVLWCSSVSKTLAPGYRAGWVAPGKYKDQIIKLKLIHSISSSAIIHEAVGNFLMTGRHDNHLRRLRKTLQQNYQHYALAIVEYFPLGTKISRPQGGLTLWIEFPVEIDTTELYNHALKNKISIAPGRMFSLQNQFQNCMRLCMGLPWTEDLKLKLKQLGNLAKMI